MILPRKSDQAAVFCSLLAPYLPVAAGFGATLVQSVLFAASSPVPEPRGGEIVPPMLQRQWTAMQLLVVIAKAKPVLSCLCTIIIVF